ncbi:hypothetical protein B0H15DRAFT_786862 [Mycena belliarum]|uniref:Uncharacterized protein n=1 Tax=Mycena belliarum TaxID=1033014 RepID=A0AAD6TZN6_9AGAR|nr:hypothetical protein B0H15DRAFT_786862 [Mycena belliae]
MPSTNYTIDDVSPMIQYAPASAWSAGDKTLDSSGINYSNNGTFTLSTTKGSSASFSFSGTQVWIFGAKRSNHGPYTVALDGKSSQFDGFSEDDDFTALFDSGPLKQGQHKVVITNAVKDPRKPFLDVDYITWSTDSDSPNITLEDTTPQFSYQPSNSWKADLPSDLSGFQGDSGQCVFHSSSLYKLIYSIPSSQRNPEQKCISNITILRALPPFRIGNAVSLFGPIGPSLGSYAIEVDGKSVGTFNATKVDYEAQQMLFLADDLGAGDHTLRVINQPSSTNQLLAIDFASVAGLPSQSASVSASPTISASASASASTSASTGGKSMGYVYSSSGSSQPSTNDAQFNSDRGLHCGSCRFAMSHSVYCWRDIPPKAQALCAT